MKYSLIKQIWLQSSMTVITFRQYQIKLKLEIGYHHSWKQTCLKISIKTCQNSMAESVSPASKISDIFHSNLITLNEVRTSTVESLKDYCWKRDFKISGSKDELMARVYCLYSHRSMTTHWLPMTWYISRFCQTKKLTRRKGCNVQMVSNKFCWLISISQQKSCSLKEV